MRLQETFPTLETFERKFDKPGDSSESSEVIYAYSQQKYLDITISCFDDFVYN